MKTSLVAGLSAMLGLAIGYAMQPEAPEPVLFQAIAGPCGGKEMMIAPDTLRVVGLSVAIGEQSYSFSEPGADYGMIQRGECVALRSLVAQP